VKARTRVAAGGYKTGVKWRDVDKMRPLVDSIKAAGGQAH